MAQYVTSDGGVVCSSDYILNLRDNGQVNFGVQICAYEGVLY